MFDINELTWNQKLKILRTKNNWTQAVAAEKCCSTQKNYWLWENAKTYPSATSQKAIARAFGVKKCEIFM